MKTSLSLIVAIAGDQVIGRDGQLPWRLSDDLKRFKRLTMGHHIIMGRKTFESIGRPLPGRQSIVITRQHDYVARGASVVHSLPEARELARDDDEAFVIGGAEIYAQALPQVDRIYLTTIEVSVRGDTRFPAIDFADWHVISESRAAADERNEFPHSFRVLERVQRPPTKP